MAKYLIQDIIPPEKGAHKKTNVKIIHHKSPEKTHAHATHKAVEHTTNNHDKEMREEVVTEGRVEGSSIESTEPVKQDPKSLILDNLESQNQNKDADESPQTFFSSVEEVKKPISTWPRVREPDNVSTTYVPPSSHFESSEDLGPSRSSWRSGWVPWIMGFTILGVALVIVMNYYSGATITALPKKDTLPLDQAFTALKSPLNGELPYSVMKVSLDETREVPATGTKTVTAKASGKIIVYNTQNVAQRLIKNTRFQSPSGKIYRINDSISIPKATVTGGKTTPGSLAVTVYADEAGPDYNSDPVDFTVPGLKGSPTYQKVYARSSGSITGGASGTIKSVSDLDLKQASDDLRIQLETKLRTKARGDLAPSQIGFDQGMILDLGDAGLSKAQSSSPDKAVVAQSGTLYFLTFDRADLTRMIVKSLIKTWDGEDVSIENLDGLSLEMKKMSGDELWKSDKLDIALKGTPILDWKIDEPALKKAIAGTPIGSFQAILTQFSTIKEAKANVHPVWKRVFPTDETKITVKVVDSMPK